ncbi:MAG TPA: class I SAM-dependent methyltransferase [bacterium]|nr:class I SAM-dependent methyltransferase [bacterium]HQL62456.1 class I SAM-dependent methyltransferase [bacterium]
MRYAFGDTDLAAQRLELLAEVFSESTRPFLLESPARNPRLCVDLGCGPGCTTHLLAETLQPERTIGLDNSESFTSHAGKTATETVSFLVHDVTQVPFPESPCDAIYCRFLLTHIRDPETVLETWGSQLYPGGFLLLEETEWIHTSHPLFRLYIEMVDAMLASQSNILFVGPMLSKLSQIGLLRRRSATVRRLPVPTALTAKLFHLNMQTWKRHPFIQETLPPESVQDLENRTGTNRRIRRFRLRDRVGNEADGVSERDYPEPHPYPFCSAAQQRYNSLTRLKQKGRIIMTTRLEQAFAEASLADCLLAELESERRWEDLFAKSQGFLSEMAAEALDELRDNQTEELDPNRI